jgi:hypothetical protein
MPTLKLEVGDERSGAPTSVQWPPHSSSTLTSPHLTIILGWIPLGIQTTRRLLAELFQTCRPGPCNSGCDPGPVISRHTPSPRPHAQCPRPHHHAGNFQLPGNRQPPEQGDESVLPVDLAAVGNAGILIRGIRGAASVARRTADCPVIITEVLFPRIISSPIPIPGPPQTRPCAANWCRPT